MFLIVSYQRKMALTALKKSHKSFISTISHCNMFITALLLSLFKASSFSSTRILTAVFLVPVLNLNTHKLLSRTIHSLHSMKKSLQNLRYSTSVWNYKITQVTFHVDYNISRDLFTIISYTYLLVHLFFSSLWV